jgi:hypothetical protein
MRHFILRKIVIHPSVNALCWREAKRLAMVEEAKRQCAVSRIQSIARGVSQRKSYLEAYTSILLTQNAYRCHLYYLRFQLRLAALREQSQRLLRIGQVVVIQTRFRRWSKERKYLAGKRSRENSQREKLRQRRDDQNERRKLRESLLLFCEARRVGGTLLLVSIYRKTAKDDLGVMLLVHRPDTCEKWEFSVEEQTLRASFCEALGVSDVSVNELFVPDHLKLIADRLMYRWIGGRRVVVLSQRGNGERGKVVVNRAVMITGVRYILHVHAHQGSIVMKCYHQPTSNLLRTAISYQQLNDWFREEEERTKRQASNAARNRRAFAKATGQPMDPADKEEENVYERPRMLRPENEPELMQWLIERLHVDRRLTNGVPTKGERLRLGYEMHQEMLGKMAFRIQGMYKRRRALKNLRLIAHKLYTKRRDWQSGVWYYVNTITGEEKWEKPYILGSEDLVDPEDKWEQHPDGAGGVYYLHPLTGRSSWLSEEGAATVVQKLWHKRQAADFRVAFPDIIKALKFQRDTEKQYAENPEKLAAIVNMALLLQTQYNDFTKARPLFRRAYEMAPQNPLVLRIYAIFLLGSCEAPRKKMWLQANDMLKMANDRDPKLEKFKVAEKAFFHWSVTINPLNPFALMNYALVKQCIHHEYDYAEKMHRRAAAISPNEDAIIRNYEDFLENRLPGGSYSGGGPGELVRRRSEIVDTVFEWYKMRDSEAKDKRFELFWYNHVTCVTKWEEPIWEAEWIVRRQRSEPIQDIGEWVQFEDQKTGLIFYYHYIKNAYRLEPPYAS